MSNRDFKMPSPAVKSEEVNEKKVEPRPVASSSGPSPSNEKKVEKDSAGVEVVALGKGFFRNSRKKLGDKFLVPSLDLVGDWMRCTDPEVEKQHQNLIKERKAKLAEAAKSKLAK